MLTPVYIFIIAIFLAGISGQYAPYQRTNKTKVLELGAIGTWGVNQSTSQFLALAQFAAWRINNQYGLIPDVEIQLVSRNCGTGSGNPPQCLLHATNLVQSTQYNISGFLTGAFTADQRLLQYVAAAFNLPHLCGFASGNLMSNKHDYPTFLRTSIPDALGNFIMIDMMAQNGWMQGIVALEDGDWGAGNRDALQTYAFQRNITLHFILCPTGAASFAEQVASMKAMDIRIFISILNLREHWIFMYNLNEAGLVGPNYVQILGISATAGISPANLQYAQNILPAGVNATELRKLQQGSIGFFPRGGTGSFYERELAAFNTDEARYWFPATRPVPAFYWYMYDAVLTYAYAVDRLQRAGVAFADITKTKLLNALLNTTFNGTTGFVGFDRSGDNTFGLFEVITITSTGQYLSRVYNPVTKSYEEVAPIVYFGGSKTPPLAVPCLCVHGQCTSGKCVCNKGYFGADCSLKEGSGLSSKTIIIISVVAGVALIGGFAAFYVFYQRRHSSLVKDIANRQQSDIPRSEISLHKKIGQGAAGEVYLASFRGTEVAVKLMLAKNMDSSMIQEFKLESAIMCALRHPNIVLFMGSCYDRQNNDMLLIMEHMARGSLNAVLNNQDIAVAYNLQVHLAYQTAQGINFLHRCNPVIIHCDIKSHNVLLDSKWNARISDFGITKLSKFKSEGDAQEALGTIYWAAPEVLNNQPHTTKSDCYAFGVVLWEIFHRKDPYNGKDPLAVAVEVIRNGARPSIDPSTPHEISEIIRRCWATDPNVRPTMEEVSIELKKLMSDDDDIVPALPRNIRVSAPTGSVFVIATEVVGANTLWEAQPRAMRDAMVLHNECVRNVLKKFRGYEISFTKEKSFLVAFAQIQDAVDFTAAVHTQMLLIEWPRALYEATNASIALSPDGKPIWRGLRLRMGMHKGMPKIGRADFSDKITYEGAVIQSAWTLMENAPEGMVLMSAQAMQFFETLSKDHKSSIAWASYVQLQLGDTHEGTYVMNDNSLFANRNKSSAVVDITYDLPSATVDMESSSTPTDVAVPWDIAFTDLKMKETVGKSMVADVKKATLHGTEVAVKVLHNQNLQEKDYFELRYLASTLNKIKHPNIVSILGVTSKPNVSIVYEYMHMGTLQSYLHSNVQISYAEKVRIVKDIVAGLLELSMHHDPKIQTHRNLKSSNVMVGRNKEIKITDFAFAELYDAMKTLTSVGMAAWMAPELLTGECEAACEATTVYSLGMLMWEIYTRKTPFDKVHPIKLVTQILAGHKPEIPFDCPSEYKNLMVNCWNYDPTLRPSMREVSSFVKLLN